MVLFLILVWSVLKLFIRARRELQICWWKKHNKSKISAFHLNIRTVKRRNTRVRLDYVTIQNRILKLNLVLLRWVYCENLSSIGWKVCVGGGGWYNSRIESLQVLWTFEFWLGLGLWQKCFYLSEGCEELMGKCWQSSWCSGCWCYWSVVMTKHW